MKRVLILLLVVVVTLGLAAGCTVVKTYDDEGQPIDIGVGQEFIIALGSNPTTGYSWQASYDETMLELVGGEPTYEADETEEGVVGAGGVEYFRFLTLEPGETEITLVYARPWEDPPPQDETKAFTVNIE
ncbi:MAG: proteinase inhibitor-like protein [Dehalococcoidia bacterium]|nr:MAG: proteinase inhibitor-like protein [Dehalococcoidia bacterium]